MDVLIPVSPVNTAKNRLAGFLAPEERARLISTSLQTVVVAVLEAGFRPAVLTSDPRVRALVGKDVRLIAEKPAANNLNAHLEDALRAMAPLDEIIVLHADLPLATGAALRELVAAAPSGPSVAIVSSGDGGTNAMLLRPPRRFELAYGPRSAARHSAAANSAGMMVTLPDIPSLRLDLDTPADVATLLSTSIGAATPVGAYLASLDLDARGPSVS